MKLIVDIDGTILNSPSGEYKDCVPIPDRIERINALYDLGHTITYWTARGSKTGVDYSELTKNQLNRFGCKYTHLVMGKPDYDLWVDDKAINSEHFFVPL